jgi:hypothetical protein
MMSKMEFLTARTLKDGTEIKEPYVDGKPFRYWMEGIVGPNWSKWKAYNSMRKRKLQEYMRE